MQTDGAAGYCVTHDGSCLINPGARHAGHGTPRARGAVNSQFFDPQQTRYRSTPQDTREVGPVPHSPQRRGGLGATSGRSPRGRGGGPWSAWGHVGETTQRRVRSMEAGALRPRRGDHPAAGAARPAHGVGPWGHVGARSPRAACATQVRGRAELGSYWGSQLFWPFISYFGGWESCEFGWLGIGEVIGICRNFYALLYYILVGGKVAVVVGRLGVGGMCCLYYSRKPHRGHRDHPKFPSMIDSHRRSHQSPHSREIARDAL